MSNGPLAECPVESKVHLRRITYCIELKWIVPLSKSRCDESAFMLKMHLYRIFFFFFFLSDLCRLYHKDNLFFVCPM
jgi:hypothetical protein